MRTIAFSEIDPWCCAVLAKHWPRVPNLGDVRGVRGMSVDVICGGFPCQDISVGHTWSRARGIGGERSGLWWEMWRIVRESARIRRRARLPGPWLVAENVSALRGRGLDRVLGSLSAIGYDAEWHCIPAAAVGAYHERDRIWIVAYPSRERIQRLWPEGFEESLTLAEPFLPVRDRDGKWEVEPDVRRTADGTPGRLDRLKCIGNAVVPQIPEIIGRAIIARCRCGRR